MFITDNQVRMNDTDMAGILYFANQFRFVHDALEDFAESEGMSFQTMLGSAHFIFVIRHVEADYLAPLQVGDRLKLHVRVADISTSSFTIAYEIYRHENELVGTAKTVHVTLDKKTRKKITIPADLRLILEKHLSA